MPALLKTTSRRPKCETATSKAASTASGSPTSATPATASRPCLRSVACVDVRPEVRGRDGRVGTPCRDVPVEARGGLDPGRAEADGGQVGAACGGCDDLLRQEFRQPVGLLRRERMILVEGQVRR